MKKILAGVLSAAMLLSLTACSGGATSSKQPSSTSGGASATESKPESFAGAKLTYFASLRAPDVYSSNADMLCYKMAEEATGIIIDWVIPPKGQESDKFNTLILSDQKPDILENGWQSYAGGPDAAMDTKVIQDITDGIKQYMPNLTAYLDKYPEVQAMVKSDSGRYYCVPSIFTTSPGDKWETILNRAPTDENWMGIMVRKDFLDQVGMKAPVTIDDYINVLTAFKEKLNIPYPFSPQIWTLKTAQSFASAYDISSSDFMDVDKKAVFAPVQDSYREYLRTLHTLYEKGLLDPDYANQDGTTCQAKIISGETGMWIGFYSSWGNALYDQCHEKDASSAFDFIGLVNPKKTADQKLKLKQSDYAYRNNGAAISTSCTQMGAALTYLDWAWSEEGDRAMNWGKEGTTFTMENGWPALTELVTKDADGLSAANAITKYIRKEGPLAMDYYNRLVLGKSSKGPGLDALAVWNSDENGTQSASFPLVTQTADEATEVSSISTNIDTYVSESFVSFVDGTLSLDKDWDSYVSHINDMDLAKLTELRQAALDRYYKR